MCRTASWWTILRITVTNLCSFTYMTVPWRISSKIRAPLGKWNLKFSALTISSSSSCMNWFRTWLKFSSLVSSSYCWISPFALTDTSTLILFLSLFRPLRMSSVIFCANESPSEHVMIWYCRFSWCLVANRIIAGTSAGACLIVFGKFLGFGPESFW